MSQAPPAEQSAQSMFESHRETLDGALAAIRERAYWSAYPEHPGAYGEDASAEGKAAFEAYLGRPFPLEQAATDGQVGEERSPFGIELGVTYPHADLDGLLAAMPAGIPAWRDAGAEARAGVCLEILARLNARSHELAQAVMHTTGQAFMMAFQAGGRARTGPGARGGRLRVRRADAPPAGGSVGEAAGQAAAAPHDEALHGRAARDRARRRLQHVPDLERLSGALRQPRHGQRRARQAAAAAPSCRSRSPSRSRATCSREAGFAPNLVALAVDRPDERLASTLATRPEIRIVDYTGSTAFGELARGERPPGRRLHREGRRQHGRDRLDRRLQGHARQPRLHALALQRPDVHDHAEPARPARRHRDGRGPQVVRRGRRGPRRRDRRAARRHGAGDRDARRDRRTTTCSRGSTRRRPARRVSCARRGLSSIPTSPTRSSARRRWSRSTRPTPTTSG